MAKRATRAASEVEVASSTSLPPIDNGKDEGPQPVVNPVLAPHTPSADPPYDPSEATTPALIPDYGTYDKVSSATLTNLPLKLFISGTDSPTQNLPTTITPALLQPALQDFSPKRNEDEILACVNGRYSAAAKGKGKALSFSDKDPTELPFHELEGLAPDDDPSHKFSSNGEWIEHTRPILQDYANRQIALPLGQRVNISFNEPSTFIQGALQLLVNRDHPQNTPVEPSRQLGPQLLENFTDVHRWATEYFRARFAMPTVGSDVPVLLTIITNNFYEAHTQLIDSIVCAALDNMHARGASTLNIEDFAFGYDFKMSHDLPFAVESSSRIHDTLECHRPLSPTNVPSNIPTITRSGRQIKLSKQAQASAKAEGEKQARKKEKGKKNQEQASSRAMTPGPPTAGVVAVRTSSATVYHTSNHGSLSHAEDNVVLAGAKCPTCGRVMPPRMPTSPTNPPLASQSQSTAGLTPSSSRRAITRPAVSSNLRLAPLTAELSDVPLPTRSAPPPPISTTPISNAAIHTNTIFQSSKVMARAVALPITTSSAQILAGNEQSSQATNTSTYQDLAQTQATPARGARANRGGRGARGRGRGRGRAAAPLTITIPARPLPVVPASTADATASAAVEVIAVRSEPSGACTTNAIDLGQTTTTSTETPLRTEMEGITRADAVRSEPSDASGGGTTHTTNPGSTTTASTGTHTVRPESASTGPVHTAAVGAFANKYYPRNYNPPISTGNTTAASGSTYYPRYYTTQTAAANTTAIISDPDGKIRSEAMVSAANAYYPDYRSSTATTTAGPSGSTRGPVRVDFSDPEQLIAHVLSAGDLPVVGTGVSGIVAYPAVTATDSGIHGTLASGSHTDIRQSKKRKLDDSE